MTYVFPSAAFTKNQLYPLQIGRFERLSGPHHRARLHPRSHHIGMRTVQVVHDEGDHQARVGRTEALVIEVRPVDLDVIVGAGGELQDRPLRGVAHRLEAENVTEEGGHRRGLGGARPHEADA
ncbi:MAG TPA: hypothetical protein VJP05_05705 [Acidimicrobiia bacterium]|nr:hypothetical protein [Acidimicrobiia bacterium]